VPEYTALMVSDSFATPDPSRSRTVAPDESAVAGILKPIKVAPGLVVDVLTAVMTTESTLAGDPCTEVNENATVADAVSVVFTDVFTAVAVIVAPT